MLKDKKMRKVNIWLLHFIYFQSLYAATALRNILGVFILTGILRFQPDILMDYGLPMDSGDIDMTLQEFWQMLFFILVIIDTGIRVCSLTWNSAGWKDYLLLIASAIIGAILVIATGFDGNRMLLTYAFWWAMRLLSLRILKQNDYIRAKIKDLKERGYEVICINLNEMTPSKGYKPKPLSEIVPAKSEDQ